MYNFTMKTISIKTELERRLEEESELSGQDAGALAEEILEHGLAIRKLTRIREKMVPQAKAAGFADEDKILNLIS